jgi:hypothetical protein
MDLFEEFERRTLVLVNGFEGIFVCSQNGYHPHKDVEKVVIILMKI